MHTDQFESAFSRFIDGKAYDTASDAVFALTRAAFEAGWQANAPKSSPEDDEEQILYFSRLILLHSAIETALNALKEGDSNGARDVLQQTVDKTDGMLSFWDPNKKDFDEGFRRYLFD